VTEKKVSLRETGSSLEFSSQACFLKAYHQLTKPVPSVTASESAFSRSARNLSRLKESREKILADVEAAANRGLELDPASSHVYLSFK
jgi:hypothetical protein